MTNRNIRRFIKKTLRRYQLEGFRYLFRHLTNGHREVTMSGTTGCGKSLMVTYLIERMLNTTQYVSAVIIAPQLQIMDGFLHLDEKKNKQDLLIYPPEVTDAGRVSVMGEVVVDHKQWAMIAKDQKISQFRSHIRASNPSTRVLVTSHQSVSLWFGKDFSLLPADLTGRILVNDEAHHASDLNQIGAFIKAWKDRGGTVIHLTATPFRTEGDILLDENAPRWTLTLADHLLSGFAPGTVKIRSFPLPMTATEITDLSGETLSAGNHTAAVLYIVAKWDKDGRPKALILVPPGAEDLATALQAELEKQGVRVFNAVKGGPTKTEELKTVLSAERRAADSEHGHYNQSQYDVILACARFNEGTDWPFCSHVYNIGMTNSFLLILQRLGRGMRSKFEIKGYPEEHKNHMVFTFLVPSASEELFIKFEQKHHDHAFMMACFMADADTGQGYLNDVTRKLSGNRPRSGKYRPSEETWEDVTQFFNADVSTCRTAAGHMIRAINALQQVGELKPTVKRVLDFMTDQMGLEGEDLDQATRALQYNLMKRKALAFQSFKNRMIHKLNQVPDFKGNQRIIREHLQPVFDETLAEFMNEVADVDLTGSVIKHVSQFTGRTVKDVARSMRKRFGVPQPTEAEIEKAIHAYASKGGVFPIASAGDASEFFGYAESMMSWQDVTNRLAVLEKQP